MQGSRRALLPSSVDSVASVAPNPPLAPASGSSRVQMYAASAPGGQTAKHSVCAGTLSERT